MNLDPSPQARFQAYPTPSPSDRAACLEALLDAFETLVGYDSAVLLRSEGQDILVDAGRGPRALQKGVRFAAEGLPTGGAHRLVVPPWLQRDGNPWLFVPIMPSPGGTEWIALERVFSGSFSESAIQAACALAQLASHVFGCSVIQDSMAEQLKRFSILIRVGQALSVDLDLERLLENVRQEVGRFFDTTNFYIALSRPESLEFVMGLAIEHGEREIDHAVYPIGNGLTGYIIVTAKPLFLPDFRKAQSFLEQEGIATIGEIPQAWMGVPLIAGDAVVGVMAIQSYEVVNAYNRADLELFSAIATLIAVAVRNAQLYEDAERRARETLALANIGRDISATLDLQTVLGRIVSSVRELLTRDSVAIFLPDATGDELRAVVVSGVMEGLEEGLIVTKGQGILGSIVAQGRAEIVNDVTGDPRALHIEGTDDEQKGEKFMAAPLRFRDTTVGAIGVWRGPDEPLFRAEDLVFLEGIGRQASIAIRNAQLYMETKKLATLDGLTSLLNRRTLHERIEAEHQKAARYRRPVSLVMVDVDHFKVVNDTYGHDVGDQVLRMIAAELSGMVRAVDTVGRYGGEEFVLLLPETPLDGAQALAERIRESIAQRSVEVPGLGSCRVTASFGVASIHPGDANHEDVLKRADRALYQAKAQGRNRVVCEEAV